MDKQEGVQLRLTRFDRLRQQVERSDKDADYWLTQFEQVMGFLKGLHDTVENDEENGDLRQYVLAQLDAYYTAHRT
jgi:hypothetical protein